MTGPNLVMWTSSHFFLLHLYEAAASQSLHSSSPKHTFCIAATFSVLHLDDVTTIMLGNGCGSVGRVVAFNTRGPQFDCSHQQNFIEHLFIINCTEKTKINKKRPGLAHFFIKKPNYFFPFLPFLYYFFLSYLFIFINHFSIFLYSFF